MTFYNQFFIIFVSVILLTACESTPERVSNESTIVGAQKRLKNDSPQRIVQIIKRANSLYKAGNFSSAATNYQKAAMMGSAKAQNALAIMYTEGRGVPQNFAEATKWFQKAANQGLPDAEYYLARMYYKGKGVPKNLTQAKKWFNKAASQGHAQAQDELGLLYYSERNFRKAALWFSKAAEQGMPNSQNQLGLMYYKGDEGVAKNRNFAYKWVLLAVIRGNHEAIKAMKFLIKTLSVEEIASGERLASEWLKKHPNVNG
jgi:TPR repeat protein